MWVGTIIVFGEPEGEITSLLVLAWFGLIQLDEKLGLASAEFVGHSGQTRCRFSRLSRVAGRRREHAR